MKTHENCEYEFTLILDGITPDSEGVEEALIHAGCDDATFAFRSGRPVLTFARTGESLKDAVVSAILDIRKANVGIQVLRIDNCNLVTQSDIARKAQRSRQVIHQYMRGIRGPGGFPNPICELNESHAVWRWCEVAHWLCQNDMLNPGELQNAKELETINGVLEMQHLQKQDAALTNDVIRSVGLICEECR